VACLDNLLFLQGFGVNIEIGLSGIYPGHTFQCITLDSFQLCLCIIAHFVASIGIKHGGRRGYFDAMFALRLVE
jgi:hypothetical protein